MRVWPLVLWGGVALVVGLIAAVVLAVAFGWNVYLWWLILTYAVWLGGFAQELRRDTP